MCQDGANFQGMEELHGYLRPSEPWESWLARCGEQPPDLNALPSIHHLPDPLAFQGPLVRSPQEWHERRNSILECFRHWVFGAYPQTPERIEAEILEERSDPCGARIRELRLRFGPQLRAMLHLELLLPAGAGPYPVFITQRNHAGWARVALARGYAAAAYNGCDSHDDTQAFKEIWPEHDWSMLCRRAWAAGRVLDWIATQPDLDATRACICGHSRNGKQALIAGAIDSRFAAVIASSSGVGGACPFRLASEAQFSEGIEIITHSFPEWFHPRLRFFAGREQKLPVDNNLLLALNAPRAVLLASAFNDNCESVKAVEAAVRSTQQVWNLHGAETANRLRIHWRSGGHDTHAEDIERYLDWCDLHFERATPADLARLRHQDPAAWLYPYAFDTWRARSGESVDPDGAKSALESESLAGRLGWLLGDAPATAFHFNLGAKAGDRAYLQDLLIRPMPKKGAGYEHRGIGFGEALRGDVFAPLNHFENPHARLPAVVWLGPECSASGYSGSYFRGMRPPAELAQLGFVAMGYDSIGNGSRNQECQAFYARYPRWSLLGKQVHDARQAVEAVCQLPGVDPERVYLLGFGEGGTVALLAAALDRAERHIAGVASVCGFSPLRAKQSDGVNSSLVCDALQSGGGLLPRLGLFAAAPEKIPVDFDEILSAVAPRPLLCVTPVLDRCAHHPAVCDTIAEAAKAYEKQGARDALWHWSPVDYRRYTPEIYKPVYEQLARVAGLRQVAVST